MEYAVTHVEWKKEEHWNETISASGLSSEIPIVIASLDVLHEKVPGTSLCNNEQNRAQLKQYAVL